MSINLEKRAAKVGIVLEKRGLRAVPAVRVGAAFDVSGSARGFYTSGVMQETIDRLLAVALKFDDNGELDAWMFHNDSTPLPTISKLDEGTYVDSHILTQRNLWGGTSYAPTLTHAMDFYFGAPSPVTQITEKATGMFGRLFGGKKEAPAPSAAPATTADGHKVPAMLLFITDGANDDQREAAQVLRDAAKNSPMYFNFVGIGPEHYFSFIKEMADELPNVGFVNLSSLSMTDEQLYEELVSQEFCDWIKKL